mmetsp:Transcript_29016/g.43841  ORF Transcript_29016/g.43841 Transcript_29016/m.43841 type:complete len:260 (+) Transcript_29016:74-853(+)
MRAVSIPIFLLTLLISVSVAANNDAERKQVLLRRLRGAPEARSLLANAILSLIRQKDSRAAPSSVDFDRAVQAGIPSDMITKLAQEAYDKMQTGQLTIQQIERDMQALVQQQQEDDNTPAEPGLSDQGLKLMSKAVLSGFRSTTGEIDPDVMEQAIQAGATREQVERSLDKMLAKHNRSRQRATTVQEETSFSSLKRQQKEESSASDLTNAASKLLFEAVMSSYQSRDGTIDPQKMEEAIRAGVTRERIMTSLALMKQI